MCKLSTLLDLLLGAATSQKCKKITQIKALFVNPVTLFVTDSIPYQPDLGQINTGPKQNLGTFGLNAYSYSLVQMIPINVSLMINYLMIVDR